MLAALLVLCAAADWWLLPGPCPSGAHLTGTAGSEVACVDGRGALHGRRTQWFPGARQRQLDGEYRRGVAHGQFVFFRKNGARALAGVYWAGKKSGRWTRWDEHGTAEHTEHPLYDQSETSINAAIAAALEAGGGKSIDAASSAPSHGPIGAEELGGPRGAAPAEELTVTAALGARGGDLPDSDMGRTDFAEGPSERASPYVKRAVAKAGQAIDRCYRASRQKPSGEIVARFVIASSGAADDVRIVKSTLTGALTDCMKRGIARLKLEPHDDAPIEVISPWRFTSSR